MSKICGIFNQGDTVLNKLVSKFGAKEGIEIYHEESFKNKRTDEYIAGQYLEGFKQRKKPVKAFNPLSERSNTQERLIEILEEQAKTANWTHSRRKYKEIFSNKEIYEKELELRRAINGGGLNNEFEVKKYIRRTAPNERGGVFIRIERKTQQDKEVYGLVPEASLPFIKGEKETLTTFYKQKRALETQAEISEFAKAIAIEKEIAAVQEKIDNSEKKISELKDIETTGQLFARAEQDLEWLADFFNKSEYTYEELNQALIKYETWVLDPVSPGSPHPYLDSMEQRIPQIVDKMNYITNQIASSYGTLLNARIEEAVIASVSRHSKVDELSNEDILQTLSEDSGILRAHLLNAGKQVSPVVQAVFNNVNKANNSAYRAAVERTQKLQDAAKELRNSDFDTFYQKNSKGQYTGRLVSSGSESYIKDFQYYSQQLRFAKIDVDTGNPAKLDKALAKLRRAQKDLFNFHMGNSDFINPGILVVDSSSFLGNIKLPQEIFSQSASPEEQELVVKGLEKRFGKAEANRILSKSRKAAINFLNERDAVIAQLLGSKSELSENDILLLKQWNKQNSPFEAYQVSLTESIIEGQTQIIPTFKFNHAIPKSKNIDSTFQEIISDPALSEFYNIVVDLMEEGRQELGDINGFLTGMSIPLMQESFFKQLLSTEGRLMPRLMDALKESISVANESDYRNNNLHKSIKDLVETKEINVSSVTSGPIKKQVNEEFLRLRAKFIEETAGEDITPEIEREMMEEAVNNVYSKSSTNLLAIMSMYALNTQTVKARRSIEPQIKLAEKFLKGETRSTINQDNAIKALDYFLDKEFYGIKPAENVGKGGFTTHTLEQRKAVESLQSQINDLDEIIVPLEEKLNEGEVLSTQEQADLEAAKSQKEDLIEQVNKMGRKVTSKKFVDAALSLTQLLGIGFSPVSAVGNVGVGYLANQMAAAEARDFGGDAFARATALILGGNVTRFFTFGASDKVLSSNHADKIRNIVDNNKMMATVFDEINHSSSGLIGRTRGVFRSSHFMERSEFINQATVAVAMMLDTEVILEDGTTTNLYEAFGDNGEPSSTIVSYKTKSAKEHRPWDQDEFFQYAKHISEELHGDYNHSVLFKNMTAGKILSTFRTWMYRTYAHRYEPEYYDAISGYVRKGTYLSAANVFTLVPGLKSIPLVGKFMPPIVFATTESEPGGGAFALSMIPPKIRKKLGMADSDLQKQPVGESLKKVFKNTGKVYGQFFKAMAKPLKYKSRFKQNLRDTGFSEVDSSNITSVFTEWMLKAQLGLLITLLFNFMDDDDDDNKRMALVASMNMLRRLENDLGFYLDFTETGRTLDNPIPAMYIFKNYEKLTDSLGRAFDEESAYVQSGYYEGWWWPARAGIKLMPLAVSVDRTLRYFHVDIQTGNFIQDKEDVYRAFEKSLMFGGEEYKK